MQMQMQGEPLKIKKPKTPLVQNMTGAICLTFVQIFSYFCICIIGATTAIFISILFKNIIIPQMSQTILLSDILGCVTTLILSFLLLSPLRLSIKGWYRRLNNDFVPLNLAFSGFTSLKRYRISLLFCLVRGIATFLLFFLPMLPSILLASFVRGQFMATGMLNTISLVVIVSSIVLFIVALTFSLFHAVDFFYVDYLFLSGKAKNPMTAFIVSKKLAKANKHELISTLLGVIPYMALCILIFPAFFVIPKIQSDLAQHAQNIVYGHEHIQGTYLYNRTKK